MVQEFNVLKCYSCKTFQVHQVKKAKRWQCKVCGEKQSTKKVYAQGSGPDCRRHVQKLNTMQGEYERFKGEEDADIDDDTLQQNQNETTCVERFGRSKWEKFVEFQDTEDISEQHESWEGLPATPDCSDIEKQKQNGKHKRTRNENSSPISSPKKSKHFYEGSRKHDGNFELPPHERNVNGSKTPHHIDLVHSSTYACEKKNLSFQTGFSGIDNKINNSETEPVVNKKDIALDDTTSQTKTKENKKTLKHSKWSKFLGSSTLHSNPGSGERQQLATNGDNTINSKTQHLVELNTLSQVNQAKAEPSDLEEEKDVQTNIEQTEVNDSECINVFQIENLEDDWWNIM